MKKGERTVHKAMKAVDKLYNQTPGFTDIFDEETFYQFAFVFTACVFVCVFLLSRYVQIRSLDPLDREHRGVRNKQQQQEDGQPKQQARPNRPSTKQA